MAEKEGESGEEPEYVLGGGGTKYEEDEDDDDGGIADESDTAICLVDESEGEGSMCFEDESASSNDVSSLSSH